MEKQGTLKPFVSVVAMISMLFIFVFAKMELRRMGYFALKLSKEQRELRDLKSSQQIKLARFTRPERIQKLAAPIPQSKSGQIIQVNGSRLALRQ